jgi:hypothetical protein
MFGDHQCEFRRSDQIFAFVRYLKRNGEYNETGHQLFTDFKKAYDSVKRGALYNLLTEFGVPIKPVRLIKMCLNKIYSKVRMESSWG